MNFSPQISWRFDTCQSNLDVKCECWKNVVSIVIWSILLNIRPLLHLTGLTVFLRENVARSIVQVVPGPQCRTSQKGCIWVIKRTARLWRIAQWEWDKRHFPIEESVCWRACALKTYSRTMFPADSRAPLPGNLCWGERQRDELVLQLGRAPGELCGSILGESD